MRTARKRTLLRAAARKARKLARGGVAAGVFAFGACADSHGPGASMIMPSADGTSGTTPTATGGTTSTEAAGTSAAPGSSGSGSGGGVGASANGGTTAGVAAGAPVPPSPVDVPPELKLDAVPSSQVARRVLFSWTSEGQVAELRADPVLLTRSENSDGTRTHLSSELLALAEAGDPLADALTDATFQKGRYAWPNAWATRRGWPDESYGTQLLRIVLEPDAWIARLRFGSIQVFDMNDTPVDAATALASPERIAAVMFLNQGEGSTGCGTFMGGCAVGTYREYFVNNEQMIEEWSLGTQEVLDEIDRGITVAEGWRSQIELGALMSSEACDLGHDAYCTWNGFDALSEPWQAYLQALALSSELYLPTVANMDALIAALQESRFVPDPLVYRP